MRKLFTTALSVILLSACQDDTTKLLKAVDGHWQIKTATYSGVTGRDSVALFTTAAFVFDRCSSSENGSSPTTCGLSFINDSNQLFTFTYQAPNQGESLYITPTSEKKTPAYQAVASQIAGSYKVITLSDNLLVIRRSVQGMGLSYTAVEYSAYK